MVDSSSDLRTDPTDGPRPVCGVNGWCHGVGLHMCGWPYSIFSFYRMPCELLGAVVHQRGLAVDMC